MSDIVRIGDATLYHGDCLEILPTLGKFDAVITDPPYGIKVTDFGGGRNGENGWKRHEQLRWDDERPGPAVFEMILQAGKAQVIWGGNYFTDYLPPTMQWLVWDKGQREFSLADCELAWSSQQRASRVFNYARGSALRDGKEHPTQKPIALMEWVIERLDKPETIVDPFMGSGTTGVACARLGRKFTGIEIERKYFDIACERIERAYAQGQLIPHDPAPIQEQQSMGL